MLLVNAVLSRGVSAEEKAREAESKARAFELRLGGDLTRESRVSPAFLPSWVCWVQRERFRTVALDGRANAWHLLLAVGYARGAAGDFCWR